MSAINRQSKEPATQDCVGIGSGIVGLRTDTQHGFTTNREALSLSNIVMD